MSSIKELVKKHFNLVEATAQSFGEVKTADGQLTLTYEGDSLAEGLDLFVVTADGNVPAPDGDHALEGGVTVSVAGGKITAIMETPAEAPAEEVVVEAAMAEDMPAESPAEEVASEVVDAVSEEVATVVEEAISEEVIAAVTEAVSGAVGEMMKKMEERMAALEGKFSTFASAPAAEKTIANKVSTTKFNSDLTPSRNKSLVEKYVALKNNK